MGLSIQETGQSADLKVVHMLERVADAAQCGLILYQQHSNAI